MWYLKETNRRNTANCYKRFAFSIWASRLKKIPSKSGYLHASRNTWAKMYYFIMSRCLAKTALKAYFQQKKTLLDHVRSWRNSRQQLNCHSQASCPSFPVWADPASDRSWSSPARRRTPPWAGNAWVTWPAQIFNQCDNNAARKSWSCWLHMCFRFNFNAHENQV